MTEEKEQSESGGIGPQDAAAEVESQHEAKEMGRRSLIHDVALIFVLCLAQILLQASLSQSILPLSYIDDSLGITDPGQESWLTAAFSLTVGTFILPAGRLGDIHGHKLVFLCGLGWYAVWSIICGVAAYSGLVLFAISRAFQGIGLSMMVPNALALLGREFPDGSKRNLVFSLFGACAPGGFQLGGVFTAIFAQFAWWPWTFWTAAMFAVAYAVFAWLVIPGRKVETIDVEFDWAGCVLGVAGLILFNFAWNQAGVVGWETPYTYALLIVSLVLLVLFCIVELKYASKPLLPVRSLSRATILALSCIAAGWASFGVWVWYLMEFILKLRNTTPLGSIAETCGIAVCGAIAALLTAYLLPRLRAGVIMILAMLAFAIGQILVATAAIDQNYWAQIFPMIIIMPFGMDFSFPSGTIILSDSMAHEDQGLAASLVTTVVNYSISLGLGIAGTITRQLTGNSQDPATILHGYRGAWYFAIGLDILGLIIAIYFAIKEK